ncbi:ATP-dependent RNA helicase A [Tothia fuscella]|uniref:ATP-dependent RNA helicase A n=1 Tax=Tothia fuscella TaxID=1048955 RepID=A0A9P4U1Z6_9PEZI|nr:ATP-dependent RNA helicase A [Tothia fuscella]
MPKNAHGPRGGGKKPPPPPDDGLNIVFSNAKGEPKKKKGTGTDTPLTAAEPSNGKGKGKAVEEPAPEDGPKKPDTRTLIGGASWTGKLPLNMFNEHCQKQKWDKPEYTMMKTPDGFVSGVIIRAINPKTREKTTLPPIRFPKQHQEVAAQESAVEARHFAATYALFRVSSMKNLHMMMPPKYKDLWKGMFSDLKREDEKEGKAWLYAPDPFQVAREREEAIAAAAKKREEIEKQKTKDRAQPGGPGRGLLGSNGSQPKGWTRAPKIDMGKRTRIEVERLIRQHSVWNPHMTPIDPRARNSIIAGIVKLGYRQSHVEEAAELCKDKEEILEWLLIHVPEDDLPPWSLPENYTADVSLASGDLRREVALKRLAASGYSMDLCEEAMVSNGGDEAKAAAFLQDRLIQNTDDLDYLSKTVGSATIEEDEADSWEDEKAVLASIYDNKYLPLAGSSFKVTIQPEGLKDKITITAQKPAGKYPNVLPTIALEAALPAYIRLAILQQALQFAQANFLGEQMVFNIVDWLEHNVSRIIQNPGRLSDVSAAAAAGETHKTKPQSRQKTRRPRKRVNWTTGTPTSMKILDQWKAKQTTPAQERMLAVRRNLPAWSLQDSIVEAVNNHQVTIISGETGSGKSTQSVQFILDDLIERQLGESVNIICTQPRRISALGLADRVTDERCGKVGEEVGYIIRGESKFREGTTKITFVTTGVLLRRLQTSGGRSEDVIAALADVSHVVVDEVHERSLDTDFLLILLRDVLRARKDLKVILMSATLDADIFAQYYSSVGPVARIEIQGRTHPVDDYYLDDVIRITGFNGHTEEEDVEDEDNMRQLAGSLRDIGMKINYDFIAQVVRQIDSELGRQEGGILIFLPGTMEIDRTIRALQNIPNIHALPLHASLLPAEQRRVFQPPPRNYRKVIASTNVAETSITIEDVVAVIDTGRVKETTFDPQNNMVRLEEVWASKAACKQRRGRAGRVRKGTCYKLFTRNAESNMAERPEPEIRRVPLEQLCLSVKAMGVNNVPGFLAGTLTPPDTRAVEGAITLLRRMGVLDGEDLTALGRHVSMIPADLRCGKLLVYGAIFGCLEACLTIAAILTVRSPFVSPQTKREESKAARSTFGQGQGDLIADLRAYEQFSNLRQKGMAFRDIRYFCEQNFLSQNTLNDITSNRSQYLSSLKEIGFLPLTYNSSHTTPNDQLNAHNANNALLRALIASSFNPQITRIEFPSKKFAATSTGAMELDPEARTIKYFSQASSTEDPSANTPLTPHPANTNAKQPTRHNRVFMHPSSTLFDAQQFPSRSNFIAYFEKVATSKVFIRNCTPVNAYATLMFGGPIELDTLGRGLVVDGWIRLRGWARIGVLVGRLRGMLDEVLGRMVEDPMERESDGRREIVDVVRKLVELDGLDR